MNKNSGTDSDRKRIAKKYNITSSAFKNGQCIDLGITDIRWFIEKHCERHLIDHNAYVDNQIESCCCCRCECRR
jgi:hypothetical protein